MAKHLTKEQRYYIWLQIARGICKADIARALGVHKSTITNEIKRNQNNKHEYNVEYAQKLASIRKSNASRSKAFKKITKRMEKYILTGLENKWSPEQISGRMKKDIRKSLSHETIYQYVKEDKRNGGSLFRLLPHKGKKYKYKKGSAPQIIDRVDISKRPKVVERKARIGDFEIDTIISSRAGLGCLVTMVDRKSKMTFVRKAKYKSAGMIQLAIEDIYLNTTIPIRTITADNGGEFAYHKIVSENIACDFYFARPYCSCDRGLNEHTNGLIRRYLPKGTNFDTISDDTIKNIENSLNSRPRKALKFKTPNEVVTKYLQRISQNQMRQKKSRVAIDD